jgi:hypothetical protein
MKTLGCLIWLAAANPNAWESLRKIPKQSWINLAIFVLIAVVSIRTWRTLRRLNEFAPYIALTIMGGMVLCYWVYERNEPRFLTPVVEIAAEVLPTKGKQTQNLEQLRKGRDADKLVGR